MRTFRLCDFITSYPYNLLIYFGKRRTFEGGIESDHFYSVPQCELNVLHWNFDGKSRGKKEHKFATCGIFNICNILPKH